MLGLNRQQSLVNAERYKNQFPLLQKICTSLIIVFYCYVSAYLLSRYCAVQDSKCPRVSQYSSFAIQVFMGAIILRGIIIVMMFIAYFSKTALLTVTILEQKLMEAEFLLTLVGSAFSVLMYIISENCQRMQTVYGLLICVTYVILRLMCVPEEFHNSFEGDYY